MRETVETVHLIYKFLLFFRNKMIPCNGLLSKCSGREKEIGMRAKARVVDSSFIHDLKVVANDF
jgi:hypothetical protein